MRILDEFARMNPGPGLRIEPGTITAVSAGAAADGNALATVDWRGTAVEAPYLSTYTPAVGHVVLLLIQPPQVVIVGRLLGTP